MSGTETAIAELNKPTAGPRWQPATAGVMPYLTVADARAAIAWYVDAFGASGRRANRDGRRSDRACRAAIAGGVLYLADEYPEIGLKAPAPQASSVSLMLHVADTDATLERARERGAEVQREPYENYGSRNATIIDPFGHRWMLSGPVTGAVVPIQHGDVGYVSVWTPDAERAAAFYGHVLGWTYDPATHQVTNTRQRIGIFAVAGPPDAVLLLRGRRPRGRARKRSSTAAARSARPQQFDFGTVLDATDPQGTPFAVFQPTPGHRVPTLNGAGPGELSYITYEVPDSAAFRAFYSRVLFWTFEPGRIDDGWQVEQTHPMAGVAGGSAPATVPMWTVDDVDAAVARVREAGGTVIEEPSRQPYGKTAQCTDDQGAPLLPRRVLSRICRTRRDFRVFSAGISRRNRY